MSQRGSWLKSDRMETIRGKERIFLSPVITIRNGLGSESGGV